MLFNEKERPQGLSFMFVDYSCLGAFELFDFIFIVGHVNRF